MPVNSGKNSKGVHKKPEHTKLNQTPFLYMFSVGIFILIFFSFIAGPLIQQVLTKNQKNYTVVGVYKNQDIKFDPNNTNYFQRKLEYYRMVNEQRFGNNPQFDSYVQYITFTNAAETTAIHYAYLDLMKTSGMHISSNYISTELAKLDRFKEDGVFSPRLFRSTSASVINNLKNSIRDSAIDQIINSDLVTDTYSQKELDFIKNMAADQRELRFVSFNFKDYPQEKVIEYGKKNANLFREIKLSRIILSHKDEAEQILAGLKAGDLNFEEVAKEKSKDKQYSETGGVMEQYQDYLSLLANFTEQETESIFQIKPGAYSPVLKSGDSYYIFRGDASAREPDFNNQDTIDKVRTHMETKEPDIIQTYLEERAKDFKQQAEQDGYLNTAASFGLTTNTTGYFPINFGNLSIQQNDLFYSTGASELPFFPPLDTTEHNPALRGAADVEWIFETIFKLKKGEISEPTVNGKYVLVMELLDKKTLPAQELDMLGVYFKNLLTSTKDTDIRTAILSEKNYKSRVAEVLNLTNQ